MQLGRLRNIKTGANAVGNAELGINTLYSIQGGQVLETMAWIAVQILANKLIIAIKLARMSQVATQQASGHFIDEFFEKNVSKQGNKQPIPVQSSWIHSIAYMSVSKLQGSIIVYFRQETTNKKAPIISLPMYSPIDFNRFVKAKSKGQFYLDNIALKTPGGKLSTNFVRGFLDPQLSSLKKNKVEEYFRLEERANWAKTFLSMSAKDRQRHRMIFDPQNGWVGKADTFMDKYGFPKNNREHMRNKLNISEMESQAEESIAEYEHWIAKEATNKKALEQIRKFNDLKRKYTRAKRFASNPAHFAKATARRKVVGNELEKMNEKGNMKAKILKEKAKSSHKAEANLKRHKRMQDAKRQGLQALSKGVVSGNIKQGFKRQSRQQSRKRSVQATKTSNSKVRRKMRVRSTDARMKYKSNK